MEANDEDETQIVFGSTLEERKRKAEDEKMDRERFFMIKKMDLVPKIVLSFIIELCIIFFYIC